MFCPYCKEAFEGLAECPEHELTLVTIDRLPRAADRAPERWSMFLDPRHGRGAVFSGASVVVVGFLLPFVEARGYTPSALEVAIDGAHNLWLTVVAALGMLLILWRRRSPVAMWRARLAVFGLAVGGMLPLGYTASRISSMASVAQTDVRWRVGLFFMAAGLVCCAISAARLGRRPTDGR